MVSRGNVAILRLGFGLAKLGLSVSVSESLSVHETTWKIYLPFEADWGVRALFRV